MHRIYDQRAWHEHPHEHVRTLVRPDSQRGPLHIARHCTSEGNASTFRARMFVLRCRARSCRCIDRGGGGGPHRRLVLACTCLVFVSSSLVVVDVVEHCISIDHCATNLKFSNPNLRVFTDYTDPHRVECALRRLCALWRDATCENCELGVFVARWRVLALY